MAVSGTEAKIYDALMHKVVEVAAALALPVALPNVSFTPPGGTGKRLPYLAATYMPNGSDLFGGEFDSDVDYQGLLQISVFWPSGAGLVKPNQVAAQVAAAFAAGTKIDRNDIRVRIDQSPRVSGALQESDLAQVPVTIRWRTFIPASA